MTTTTDSEDRDFSAIADRAYDLVLSDSEIGTALDRLTAASLGRDIPADKDEDAEWWDRFTLVIERLLNEMIKHNKCGAGDAS